MSTTSSGGRLHLHHEAGGTSFLFSDNIEDYDFYREIGRGSFGSVSEAVDKTSGKKCAIKTIFKQSSNREQLKRIVSEASIHKRASNHENIAKLYRVIEDDDNVYLVMELCSGGSLKGMIQTVADDKRNRFASPNKHLNISPCSGYGSLRKSTSSSSLTKSVNRTSRLSRNSSPSMQPQIDPILPFPLIRSILKQVCLGLDFLHRNGVVHRDLNVNNLMLESRIDPESRRAPFDVKIKIIDFGLAMDANSINNNNYSRPGRAVPKKFTGGTICGTAGFISPEVYYQSESASPASDVFALGSILYYMVTGVIPPAGEKIEEDLSCLPSLLVSLLCLLWNEDPKGRPTVRKILEHPFILGPICTKRLLPTHPPIIAKNQEMSINDDSSVTVKFLDKDCSITVSKNSREIVIVTKSSDKPRVYSMETLPESRWKWFARVHDFVSGIKATTPKIKKFVQAQENLHHKISSIDAKGNRLTIIGGILTEAATFKAFVRDDITGSQSKVILNESLRDKNPVLFGQVKDLFEKCLRLEDALESLGEQEGEDLFPFTSGRNPVKNTLVEPKKTFGRGKENRSSHNTLTLDSESVTFDDVVNVDMFPPHHPTPEGLQVDWRDGSSMYFFTDGRITYKDSLRRPERVIHANEYLSPDVKRKVSMMPLLYKRATETRKRSVLRDCNSLQHHHPSRLKNSYSHISC